MKTLNEYIVERGPAPNKKYPDPISIKRAGDGCVQMIQTILNELKEHTNCSYDKEHNKWVGKDGELITALSQFIYDYLQTLNQNDLKKIVEHFGWKKWIADINDINLTDVAMCISLELNLNNEET